MTASMVIETADVRSQIIEEILIERARQLNKWGWQRHPDGTAASKWNIHLADVAKNACDQAATLGQVTWTHILNEEKAEAYAEDTGTRALRTELTQVAAVALAWLEDLATR